MCVCVCVLEREMACIYSYVYTHISTYLGAFCWETFSFDTALLCFVLSQTIKEMIRGFQSKHLTIGKGECGLIEAPFPHFLLSGEGQPRLMQHLHFSGLVPDWNLLPPYFPLPTLGPSGLVKFSVLVTPNPCDFFQDCESKCHPQRTITNTLCWWGLFKSCVTGRKRKEEVSPGKVQRGGKNRGLGRWWMISSLMVSPKTSPKEVN